MGGTLGTLFARAGHEVVFSHARHPDKLTRLARQAGRHACEATRGADALLLAVHWSRVPDVLRQAGPLAGHVLIICSLPMNAANTDLVVAHRSSGAEALARNVRRTRVVSAFGTVPSEVLPSVFEHRKRSDRPSLVFCGDHPAANRLAARLIRDVGFDSIEAGPLRLARYLEPFTLLVAQLAYERPGGPRLAYRFDRW